MTQTIRVYLFIISRKTLTFSFADRHFGQDKAPQILAAI